MTVADLLQLLSVRGKLIFSQFFDKDNMKHLLDLQLWHLFEDAELTKVVRQNDKLPIGLLNKVRVGNINDDVEKLLKAKFMTIKSFERRLIQSFRKIQKYLQQTTFIFTNKLLLQLLLQTLSTLTISP